MQIYQKSRILRKVDFIPNVCCTILCWDVLEKVTFVTDNQGKRLLPKHFFFLSLPLDYKRESGILSSDESPSSGNLNRDCDLEEAFGSEKLF